MTIGLVGRKSGMTRVFTDDGASIPVTVVEITPNRVTQIKDVDSDGYRAIQVTAGSRKAAKVSKANAGHFAKAGVEAGRGLWEFRIGADDDVTVGAELTVEAFEVGQKVDAMITGFDRSKKPNFSIKARQIAEEKEAVQQFGSSDSGASLGDILGEALKGKDD